jgi:hypothetical protein
LTTATLKRLQNRERELEALLNGQNNAFAARDRAKGATNDGGGGSGEAAAAAAAAEASAAERPQPRRVQVEVAWAAGGGQLPCAAAAAAAGAATGEVPWLQTRTCAAALLAAARALSLARDRHLRPAYSRTSSSSGDGGDDWPGEGARSGGVVAMLEGGVWQAVRVQTSGCVVVVVGACNALKLFWVLLSLPEV